MESQRIDSKPEMKSGCDVLTSATTNKLSLLVPRRMNVMLGLDKVDSDVSRGIEIRWEGL